MAASSENCCKWSILKRLLHQLISYLPFCSYFSNNAPVLWLLIIYQQTSSSQSDSCRSSGISHFYDAHTFITKPLPKQHFFITQTSLCIDAFIIVGFDKIYCLNYLLILCVVDQMFILSLESLYHLKASLKSKTFSTKSNFMIIWNKWSFP